ncbi:MAG TPA: class I SAM-dependent methyltransferase [Candidatus Elarobacter sp.]
MLYYEKLYPGAVSLFDGELDQIVRSAAAARGMLDGMDPLTGQPTRFTYRGSVFREDLYADGSESMARHRSLMCGLSLGAFGHPFAALPRLADRIGERNMRLYLAEWNTPLEHMLRDRLAADRFVCSEYFGERYRSGDFVGGVLHQDLMSTSFEDASFDVIVTSEVLEHVPDATRAEREIVRILRPGGLYVFTVPIDVYAEEDKVLAELGAGGSLVLHGPPVYHGDPKRPEGILAYRIFSVAGLTRRFTELGCSITTYRFWSKMFGLLGEENIVNVMRKP